MRKFVSRYVFMDLNRIYVLRVGIITPVLLDEAFNALPVLQCADSCLKGHLSTMITKLFV